MKYDLYISKEMINESPHAFKAFVFGACSAFFSLVYTINSNLLLSDRIPGFRYYPFGHERSLVTAINLTKFTPFSTNSLLIFLIFLVILFSILMIIYNCKAFIKNESSFLFSTGLFLSLGALACLFYDLMYNFDVTNYYLFRWRY